MQYLPPCIRRMLGAPRISRRYIHYVTARHKKRQVIPLEETTNALSPEILRRYIGRTINLAKSELNVLLEEEACTNTLSIEQLELRGLAMFDLVLDPHFMQEERGGYNVRLLFRGSRSSGVSPPSQVDRSFRIKSFRVGKLVELGNERESGTIPGIVCEVKDDHILVDIGRLSAQMLNELVRKGRRRNSTAFFLRQRSHVDQAHSAIRILKDCQYSDENGMKSEVTRQIFGAINGEYAPHPGMNPAQRVFTLEQDLAPAQYRAVQLCAHRQPVTLIHGPPGTGKTATLAAAIISAAVNGDRVLVTAPSHAACDAVTAAVAKRWCHKALGRAEDGNLLRLANPLRLTDFSMSKYVVALESRRGTYKEAHDRVSAVKASLFREKNKKKLAALLDEFNRELGNVRRERMRCENAAVSNAKVVVCTNNHACNMSSNRKSGFNVADFDLVCYDEAGFALDTEVLPAVLASRRIIMSGDHLQLPPVVLSREAKNGGLDVSLFEKLCRSMTDNVVLLNKQFRANALISGWSSKFFYNSLVVADSSVASIALHDLPGVRETAETRTNLLFLDTASEGYTETQVEDDRSEEDPAPRAREEEESIANHEEALVVEMLLRKFLHLGVAASDVGVISPYWAQVALLRHLIWSDAACRNVEVRTVDGYQGREKELILLSLVRSNAEKTVGFLRESRRVNVSLTRAKRCCIVVGDGNTLSSDHALRHFIDFCRKNNAILPVRNIFAA